MRSDGLAGTVLDRSGGRPGGLGAGRPRTSRPRWSWRQSAGRCGWVLLDLMAKLWLVPWPRAAPTPFACAGRSR